MISYNSVVPDNINIVNSKTILFQYAQDNGFPNAALFIDGGVSATTFDREGFHRMIAAIEAAGNSINCVDVNASNGSHQRVRLNEEQEAKN